MSDYAYMKTKFKLTHKIGLTGNIGCDLQTVAEVFKSRGYETLDIGKLVIDAFKSDDVIMPALTEC